MKNELRKSKKKPKLPKFNIKLIVKKPKMSTKKAWNRIIQIALTTSKNK